jgi:hypothetical protein
MSLIGTILLVFGLALIVAVVINSLIRHYYWKDYERREDELR